MKLQIDEENQELKNQIQQLKLQKGLPIENLVLD